MWLNYNCDMVYTILGYSGIRFRISSKMLSNDIYIILFDWITFFGLTNTVLCNANIRFRISLKNAFKWYIYHSIWLNYLFWPHNVSCNTNIRFTISSKNAFKWYIYLTWLNYLFWLHLYHMRQFWYQNLNLLKNCHADHPVTQNGNQHFLIWQVQNCMQKVPKFWTI